MVNGWILLHRQLKSHWIWENPIKLKWWLDILLTVNHTETKVLVKGKLLVCGRGESLRSLDTWAKDWGVDKKAVFKFFSLLESDGMLTTVSETVTTRLRVNNYDTFNDVKTIFGNGFDNAKETEGKRKRGTNKEGLNNDKERINNLLPLAETDTSPFAKLHNYPKATPEQVEAFDKFSAWIVEHTPHVAKMKNQITLKNFLVLKGAIKNSKGKTVSITKDETQTFLLKIENNAEYQRRYLSPYLCIIDWHENNNNGNKKK